MATIGAAFLTAGCSHSPSVTSTVQGSSAALRVLHVYRQDCRSDGTSAGITLELEIKGYRGQLLSAGAATAADPDPLVSAGIRPASSDWRHIVTLTPLADKQVRLAAGRVQIRFGVSIVRTGKALLARPLSVIVPSTASGDCIKS
jgi:hypothetical protein